MNHERSESTTVTCFPFYNTPRCNPGFTRIFSMVGRALLCITSICLANLSLLQITCINNLLLQRYKHIELLFVLTRHMHLY